MQFIWKAVCLLFESKLDLPSYLTLNHLNFVGFELLLIPLIGFTTAYGYGAMLIPALLPQVLSNTKLVLHFVHRVS